MTRVLVFSPFSGIWPHGLSESQLLSQLEQDEYEFTYVTCGGMFIGHCVVMESFRLDHDAPDDRKSNICRLCKKCSLDLHSVHPAERLVLDHFLQPTDIAQASAVIHEVGAQSYLEATFRGIEVGRLSSYETLIKFKKTSTLLTDGEFEYYKKSLHAACLSVCALERLFSLRTFDRIVLYSPQYSANMMCAELARRHGIPVYFLEGSSNIHERYRAVRVWSWNDFKMVNPALSYFRDVQHKPVAEDRTRVESHFEEIELGRNYSVYSAKSSRPRDIREVHRIGSDKKILLATLSSYDEAFSALVIGGFPVEKFESDVFASQFDWISALVEWVSARTAIHLVVRLHPRDLPNRRDSIVSEQSSRWLQLLERIPSNVSVDHPDQRIPLADYFPAIQAMTTGWSSTAIEAMMKEIPVVTYDQRLPSFPAEIHYSGRTIEEYWMNLEGALSATHSPQIRERTMEWMSFNFNRGTVRVRGRLFDQTVVQRNRLLYYAVGGCMKFLPGLSRKIDILVGRKWPVTRDRDRFRNLFRKTAKALYEV